MKTNKKLLIALSVLFGLLTLLIIFSSQKISHNWSIDAYPTIDGHHPYDISILDSLLMRSLPNGYSIRQLREYDEHIDEVISINYKKQLMHTEICKASADTSLLAVIQYPWEAYVDKGHQYSSMRISPMLQLLRFAQNGGKALLVIIEEDYDRKGISLLDELNLYDYESGEYRKINNSVAKPYSPEWFGSGPSPIILSTAQEDDIIIDSRMCINKFVDSNYSKTECPNLDPGVYTKEEVIIRPMLIDRNSFCTAYAIDISYPDTGGHLYVNLLGLAFTNLGLTAPHSHEVVSQLISRIDDRPVARIIYPQVTKPHGKRDAYSVTVLDKIRENEALSFAWTLSIALALLVLSCGLMRRHPAVKGIEAEDIDRTDAVAVREYKFRKSPLLHFLYQCSWLYNGTPNYRDLLDVNYRRLARTVSKYADVELATATETDLKRAAEVFSSRQQRNYHTVLDELKWMQSFGQKTSAKVSPRQYKYSQKIIEEFV